MLAETQYIIISVTLLVYLGFLSLIDIKDKKIPSVVTTSAIFVLGMVNYQTMMFGILGAVFGLFLWELGVFHGIADIKGITILGLMIADLKTFLLMMGLIALFSLVYQFALKRMFKYREGQEIPFLPIFFFTYLAIFMISLF